MSAGGARLGTLAPEPSPQVRDVVGWPPTLAWHRSPAPPAPPFAANTPPDAHRAGVVVHEALVEVGFLAGQ